MPENNSALSILPDMTVLDIISAHRETEAIFRSYDAAAGECVCCNALFETMQMWPIGMAGPGRHSGRLAIRGWSNLVRLCHGFDL